MPRFEPFAGLRYDSTRVALDDVIAPPYDVVDDSELARLEARSAHNAIRVELPRGRYTHAAELLRGWEADGVLRADARSLYGYRMSFAGEDGSPRRTDGVIGALGIETPGEGDVLPHEHTTPKAKSDRLALLEATAVNTSPIWGLTMAAGVSDALALGGEPDGRATDDDGVVHELWRLADGRAVEVASLVESQPVVIADGHHRYETAHAYREAQRTAGAAQGPHDLVMALLVELSPEQLEVRAIHRLLSGLPPDFDLLASLASGFGVTETDATDDALLGEMRRAASLALVTRRGRWLLRPLPAIVSAAEHDLDSSRLDAARVSLPPHEVRYQHGVGEVVGAVGRGDADAAVLLRPATVDQITETGRTRRRMPPKTTFFWPKPRTGLVFRPLR